MALNKTVDANKERLKCAAIKRDGVVHERGFKSHWELRAALDPDNTHDHYKTVPGDTEGFMTSAGRFVERHEAREIGVKSGQCSAAGRELLSSDIDW